MNKIFVVVGDPGSIQRHINAVAENNPKLKILSTTVAPVPVQAPGPQVVIPGQPPKTSMAHALYVTYTCPGGIVDADGKQVDWQ